MRRSGIRPCQHWRRGAVLLAGFVLAGCQRQPASEPAAQNALTASQQIASSVAQIEAAEEQVNKTVWAKEILAQECGHTIEQLWDDLNAATNKLALAASFPVGGIVLPKWNTPRPLPHGIELRDAAGPTEPISQTAWHQLVDGFAAAGWQLVQCEFRHNRFDTDPSGQPRQSRFYFSAHLTNAVACERASLEGDLVVDWAPAPGASTTPIARVDASHLTLKTQRGQPPFELVFTEPTVPVRNSKSIDPLILYDLDGDGHSEIILPALNKLYRRTADGRYRTESLCRYSPGVVYAAVIADFDGDGVVDLLSEKYEGLVLYKGSTGGVFDQPGRLVWAAPGDVKYPMVLSCGDIDHDGDLDIFLGQYKLPYSGGQMPTPFYDANDGYPAYLLINDGHGNFSDATDSAGLSAKAHRRVYAASFADLDADGHLDLLVASDFAGVDVYRNDGRGHFSDVTKKWLPESHLFGMAQTLADFNSDGRLDFFVSGMPSATADRLEHLGLWRQDSKEDRSMRSRMTHGNRLFLAVPQGGFEEASSELGVDRSGWSWGCVAGDFDNDGFPDIYVANGMESRSSVRDYEGQFWLHDAYVGTSSDNPVVSRYLDANLARVRGKEGSYGGYESNKLFLNLSGGYFLEAAYLFGIALGADCRNTMVDDLDGDGRVDLIVTGYEPWPDPNQRISVYRNTLPDTGNWIGFRFREEGNGVSPVGIRVTIRAGDHAATQELVVGESYRSQRANALHFGIGRADHLDRVDIEWINGQKAVLLSPTLNRYHWVSARSN